MNIFQVSMLQDKLEEQSKVNEVLSKSSHSKIKQLKESLDKKKTSFHEISNDLQSSKNEVLMRDQKISTLNELVNELKNELSAEKTKCKQLESEVQLLKENKSKLELIVSEVKKKEAELEKVVNKLENDIDKINVEQKIKLKEMEEKHEESIAYSQGEHASEVKHLQSSFKDKESTMKSKIESLEKEKANAEEKISQLKSEVISNKLKAEEDVFNIKTQHKHEQLQCSKQYDERISALQTSRDEQHVQLSKYLNQIAELQKELNLKGKELSELKEERDAATKELHRKESDYRTETSRLKMDLESEKKTQDNLRDKISSLESNTKENVRKHKDFIANKDREIECLEEKLQAREIDLKRQREDEIRRADLLESAIFTYVNSTRSPRPPSPSK
jgi:chromosome segregation ATPase